MDPWVVFPAVAAAGLVLYVVVTELAARPGGTRRRAGPWPSDHPHLSAIREARFRQNLFRRQVVVNGTLLPVPPVLAAAGVREPAAATAAAVNVASVVARAHALVAACAAAGATAVLVEPADADTVRCVLPEELDVYVTRTVEVPVPGGSETRVVGMTLV